MARRRRRRNPINPINQADWTPIIIGALGGAACVYLYLSPQIAAAQAAAAPSGGSGSFTLPSNTATTPAASNGSSSFQ